jgi:hypothetical protein
MPATTITTKQLTPALAKELSRYFATHNAAKLSRNLRCMLLDYLAYELRVGVPLYTEELLWQLNDLFELLDLAAQETNEWHVAKKASKAKKKSRA